MAPTLSRPLESRVGGVPQRYLARWAFLILGLLACFWGMWSSAQEGLSQLLAGHSLMTNQLEEADRAVKLGSATPEAHYARASLLFERDELVESVKEFERSVALRPRDYALWLELGRARDRAGDVAEAVAAFRESSRLAPFYAQPYWQLGNMLLRTDHRDEAIAELRRAAASDPKLLPTAISFAWAVFNGDAPSVERAIQPGDVLAHMTLATFFATHGKARESITQFRAAGSPSNEPGRALLADLLASKNFTEAFEVWSSGRQAHSAGNPEARGVLMNPGFEEPITLNDPGFGWQLASNLPAVRASLDPAEPHNGADSLRLDWNGESSPASPVISQLVLVEPKTRYRLTFAVRTQEMLTIGSPVVTLSDAAEPQRVLAQSETFSRGTSGWKETSIEFATGETTKALLLAIRRQDCATTPCAAIGHAWVDDFSLLKI